MNDLLIHQQKAKTHLSEWKVGALFMEPGTGKTRVSVEIINSSICDLCVWIGPLNTIRTKNGMPSVKDEIEKWGGLKMPVVYVGVESIQCSDRIYLETIDLLKNARKPFVVVDESLKIKNAEAKRTKRILKIGSMVDYKLILNGTPLSRNLLDMWSQMEFLSPLILKMSLCDFKNIFCKITKITKKIGPYHFTKEFISGFENVDYLYSLIRHYVFECDLNLAISQNFKHISFYLSDYHQSIYDSIKNKYLEDEMLEWKNNNIFMEMTTKMQHAYCLTENKFERIESLFKSIPEKDTIIFCRFINSQEECKKRFPKSTVLSYQKESLGLNLQYLNHTIYFDKIWDYGLKIQSGHRTFRTGNEKDCYYYDLTGDVGLERMIDRNMDKKISMSEYFKTKTKEEIIKEL